MEGDTSKISQCNPEHPLTFEHCKIEYLYLVVDLDNISVNVTSTPSNSILELGSDSTPYSHFLCSTHSTCVLHA